VNLERDLLGGTGGLVRQFLDLRGDHGKALARLARPGSLDRGVQRQQVRLTCDGVDQGDDIADLVG